MGSSKGAMMMKTKIAVSNKEGQDQEFVIEEFENHIVLCTYLSKEIEDVEIPEEVNNKLITHIGDACFVLHKEIKSVSFPKSLTSIGAQAFEMCKGIGELLLPDSVSEISEMAFRDCTGLRRIILPAGLRVLKTGVFSFTYLSDNVEIILNDGLEEIEAGVFSSGGLNLFFTLRIPESVKKIAPHAFAPGMNIITSLPRDDAWFAD